MAEVEVQVTEQEDRYVCEVTVVGKGGYTRHHVTLRRSDYERLTGGQVSPEELVRASFRFLLEREPKESILRRFDLPVIGYYFPEYEKVIRRQLGVA